MSGTKVYKIKQTAYRLFFCRIFLLLLTCWIIFPYCNPPPPDQKIREVDSLIALTINLQKKISSQDVQMLNDFSYEMDKDLSYFYDTVLQQLQDYNMPQELEEYADLQRDMENCLAACKKYNEEIFLIENNLRDVRDRLYRNNKNLEELERLIKTEKDLFDDLLIRIENNIGFIDRHVEKYLYLKPLIDTLKLNLIVD